MNRQKKMGNHWVSQAYLRSFAADENRKKIWTLSKNAGEPALKLIEKVAVRFYLYGPFPQRPALARLQRAYVLAAAPR
jgi:hypothetical protein